MLLKGSKTEKNLLKTFAGESRARNKYTFYADKARAEGYEYIASIFEETGENEKAHAREVFNRFLKLVGTTEENLREAAEGESFESFNLYKQFEEEARREYFYEIADFYKELQEVEEAHNKRYLQILNNLEQGKMYKRDRDAEWQCMNCGYIHTGKEAPKNCPLCKYPQAYFKIKCEDYK
ncbi:rubrerythrin [Oceanirhabdus sp. W0125-5]|uniref:rubrerythrin n=1 Tax=Oceanirhabdus sp. W0125-5 TaxID=2999116 RepID=UPI0022F33461|nr:rubrerythrin family protein [Oceanirhabdus sp. W0125-5]WBW95905.1 rubrerythrin family protein [Oceanirhabdus sp. W0125-5]